VVHRSLILPHFGQPERRGIYCSSNLLRECKRVSTVCRTSGLIVGPRVEAGNQELAKFKSDTSSWILDRFPFRGSGYLHHRYFFAESLVHSQVPALFKNHPSYSLSSNFSLLRPWQEYDGAKNQREHSSKPSKLSALNPHTLERAEQTTLSVTSHNSRWPQGYGLESQR